MTLVDHHAVLCEVAIRRLQSEPLSRGNVLHDIGRGLLVRVHVVPAELQLQVRASTANRRESRDVRFARRRRHHLRPTKCTANTA